MTEDDIESFDPNEVMAKAYMSKKPEEETAKPAKPAEPEVQSGPLAFLGLQQRPKDDEETEVSKPDDKKEDTNDAEKSQDSQETKEDEEPEVR